MKLEIIIKPELRNIRITVTESRVTFKFRNLHEKNKYYDECIKIANKVIALKYPFSLRARYYPDDIALAKEIHFETDHKKNGKRNPLEIIIKI